MSRVRQDYDHLIKLLLIGDSGVGKSCLLLRFSDDTFTNSFITTIGIDFKTKNLQIDNKWVRLQIWDTAGQERFRTITSGMHHLSIYRNDIRVVAYYRNAMGILLVYDVSDEGSFKNVRNWMENIKENASENVSKVLVGNKCDIREERAVPYENGQALAREFGIPFFETSAKTGENVTEVYTQISKSVLQRLEEEKKPDKSATSVSNIVRLGQTSSSPVKKESCC